LTLDIRDVRRKKKQSFLISSTVPNYDDTQKNIYIIADNLSVHKHENIKNWLKKHKRVKIFFTPTYSSWLNQIEIWFNILSRDVLKDGVWDSKEELVECILKYIKHYNETKAKPFKWTYTGKALTK